jgi:hypothetical protein
MKISVRTAGLLVLLLAPTLGPLPLQAQDWPVLAPGVEVRIDAPAYQGRAMVVRAEGGELELAVPGLAQTVVVPASSVRRLEARVRRTGWQGARRGALWGAPIGVAAGLFGDPPEDEDGFWNSSAGVAVGMGLVGAGIGAAIGATWAGHRWVRVAVPAASAVGLGPGGRFEVVVRYTPGR